MFCFIDVDCLKQINDSYGHLQGDLAISTTVRIIKESAHSSDYGGDEFLLILPGCTIEEAKPFLEIDFSYGFAVYNSEENDNADKLIDKAEQDMYKNKWQKEKKFKINGKV